MYLPHHFEISDPALMRDFMCAHPLATLVVADASGLTADHIPLLVTGDEASGWRLAGHVARANPLWKKAEAGLDGLAIFHGPQHYISPNWYATKQETGKVVPTWNYEVVHVRGRLHAVDDVKWLRAFLELLTQTHEVNQAQPWRMQDAPDQYIEHLLEMVVGIEMTVLDIQGKAKVSQNQPIANQRSLIDGLRQLNSDASLRMAQVVKSRSGE